ncbi:hypothetical protein EPUS_00392 [Endocarpon pusillum Z07020]|uniref:F-box domain-containing protein n=1 Tax=Endocarpon pusillum (strain Z07020 / HMAS-L-300199) TaxID=1263415 RepID=U1HMH5_ENDPU|nr:uncharacterized protein EPUS_00392 [Endocarpon pusillum Z07020]ERF70204.1 hypothetical protein EPUS_00392 [Endocarpon pusillum Z07020]
MEFHRSTLINPLNCLPAEISLKIFFYSATSEPQALINLLLVNHQFYEFCKAHEETLVRGVCYHTGNRLDWSLVLKDNPTFGALLNLKRETTVFKSIEMELRRRDSDKTILTHGIFGKIRNSTIDGHPLYPGFLLLHRIANLREQIEKKILIHNLPLEFWAMSTVFHEYIQQFISLATNEVLATHTYGDHGNSIDGYLWSEIRSFLVELSLLCPRAARDFLLRPETSRHFTDPAETQRWARAFAAKYTNITEANTIIEYHFQRASNRSSERVEPERPISECLRLIPDARLDNATIDFARQGFCQRHVAEDVLQFSGLISAAEKENAANSQKLHKNPSTTFRNPSQHRFSSSKPSYLAFLGRLFPQKGALTCSAPPRWRADSLEFAGKIEDSHISFPTMRKSSPVSERHDVVYNRRNRRASSGLGSANSTPSRQEIDHSFLRIVSDIERIQTGVSAAFQWLLDTGGFSWSV